MLILGLTGGIATGKSSASKYLETRGIALVDADRLAREVVEVGRPAYHRIVQIFGHLNILQENSRELDRKRLGDLVFSDPSLRRQLNGCTHGFIRREALKQLIEYFFRFRSMVVWDIPLLFEVGLDRYLSNTLVIACESELQFKRLKQRDQIIDDQQVRQRIDAQMDLNEKCRRARYIIENNGTLENLHKQLNDLLIEIEPNPIQTTFWFVILSIPLALTFALLRLWDLIDYFRYRN